MTQETVDLTNCDREPIHIPGSIQPHGAMLVCQPEVFRVLYASENAPKLLGLDGLGVGDDLAAAVGDEVAHDIRNAAAKAGGSEIAGILLGVRLRTVARPLDVMVHRHEDRVFVEFEPCAEGGPTAEDALDLTQTLIRRIGLETEVLSIAKAAAKLSRAMLGYDRVMVYQFLHNGAGRVIAEAKQPHLASFMGQHFPAGDIPYQARRLYLLNTIRMISDSRFKPVPLLPSLTTGDPPVDMSFAQLRSVSPIHCEYLQNMGVQASMSISIVVEGELWGLISCHHDTPKIVPVALRIGAELFGHYVSLQLSMAERRAQVLASNLARERLDRIVASLSADGSLIASLRSHFRDFAALIASDGAALWMGGEWIATGTVPPLPEAQALLRLVAQSAQTRIWHSQELRTQLSHEIFETSVAGVLAIPLSSVPRDYLMFFRSEEAHNIEWGGEPVKNTIATPQGERLTPRGSFDTWKQEVKGRSKPWANPELAVAEAIQTYLRDIVLRHNEITADERVRSEQRRRVLNDELNHRVKNIIALVKSIALQTGAHATSVADYSASLEGRLRALAFAHDQSLAGGNGGDLATLIEAEAGLHRYGAAPDRVTASGPRVQLDDRTFGVLALIIHEMMTNAAKYGALSVATGKLAIRWTLDDVGNCEIDWVETGGPAVATPTREGFGSKLIQSTLAYDLGGSAAVVFAAEGVQARFMIPACHVSPDARPVETRADVDGAASTLAGLSVLVVEDQALIAFDTEDTLRILGAADVRPVPNVKDAKAAMQAFDPDLAVLDFSLGGETAEAIADDLIEARIPFVFATGYGDNVTIPGRFHHVPVVRKPINRSALAIALASAQAGVCRQVD
jgi:light-regulated signal transduction histidine kinase (bacteriophytochrome)